MLNEEVSWGMKAFTYTLCNGGIVTCERIRVHVVWVALVIVGHVPAERRDYLLVGVRGAGAGYYVSAKCYE